MTMCIDLTVKKVETSVFNATFVVVMDIFYCILPV